MITTYLSFVIWGILAIGSYYCWKKLNKYYGWLCIFSIITILSKILKIIILSVIALPITILTVNVVFLVVDIITFIVFVCLFLNDYFVAAKIRKFIAGLKKNNAEILSYRAVIFLDRKILVLESIDGSLELPGYEFDLEKEKMVNNDVITHFTTGIELTKKQIGLTIIKPTKYLCGNSYARANGKLVAEFYYEVKTITNEVKIDSKNNRNFYWVEIGDDKFNKLPQPVQEIIKTASKK